MDEFSQTLASMYLNVRNILINELKRTGTLGLYSAVKVLGYKPYHMIEVVLNGGVPHMKIFEEAIKAEHNRFLGIKRYDKADFEKWLADYDVSTSVPKLLSPLKPERQKSSNLIVAVSIQCLVELASYLGAPVLDAYLEDPDVKFILTERDPDKWVTSFQNTIGDIIKMIASFPVNLLRFFNLDIFHFFLLNQLLYYVYSDGTQPDQSGNAMALRRNYVE
jgi:hypothetical protein